MSFGRIGGLLIIGGALMLVLAVPIFVVQGGPGLGMSDIGGLATDVSLALFGFGAAVLSVGGPQPLQAPLVRVGLGALAVGQLSALAFSIGAGATEFDALESLPLSILLIVGLGAVVLGWLITGLGLVRRSGPPRVVGALLVSGLLLYALQLLLSSIQIELPADTSVAALALTVLGNAGVGVLAVMGNRSTASSTV